MSKQALPESESCGQFIRPAIEATGWNGMLQMFRVFLLRAGRVIVRRGRQARRDQNTVLRAD